MNKYAPYTFYKKLIFLETKDTRVISFLMKNCIIKTDIISYYSLPISTGMPPLCSGWHIELQHYDKQVLTLVTSLCSLLDKYTGWPKKNRTHKLFYCFYKNKAK